MKVTNKFTLLIVTSVGAVGLIVWSLDAFGFRSPAFAFLVNWLVMAWVAIAGQAMHFSFPPRYYEIKPFEQSGRVYEVLGIRLFKSLVRRGPLTIFSPMLRFPKDKTVSALQALGDEMRRAESGHAAKV